MLDIAGVRSAPLWSLVTFFGGGTPESERFQKSLHLDRVAFTSAKK